MYASPADALLGLMEGEPCRITSMPTVPREMNNGIKYFAVEVTTEKGVQYGIAAYDKEAEELYQVAVKKGAAPQDQLLITE